jgi:hypothetical protein
VLNLQWILVDAIVSAYRPQQLSTTGGEERWIEAGDLAESVLADHASRAGAAGVESHTYAGSCAAAEPICDVAAELDADLMASTT